MGALTHRPLTPRRYSQFQQCHSQSARERHCLTVAPGHTLSYRHYMRIERAVTGLGAWQRISGGEAPLLPEIASAIAPLAVPSSGSGAISELTRELVGNLFQRGWQLHHANRDLDKIAHLDALKSKVGIDITFAKEAFIMRDLFVKLPLLHRASIVEAYLIVVPTRELAQRLPSGATSFERVADFLRRSAPLPMRTPFAVLGLGYSDDPFVLTELTSLLDDFLVSVHGLTLAEIKLVRESADYDFKVELPEARKLAKEVCGFANHLHGGTLLFGITDTGDTPGIPAAELDRYQRDISQFVAQGCQPIPVVDFHSFPAEGTNGRYILAVRVRELPDKPCVAQERVYVRIGTTTRAATAGEIRQLILGGGQ
jgi:hypothetical protein